ncbi:hypothetical protein ABVT39_000772 [Epinephelus coioides]
MREQTDELATTAHDGADEPGRRVTNTAPVMKEACDTVISQVRFSQSDHLIAAKLVDTSLFPDFVQSFPTPEFDCAVKIWPVGNTEKLKSELTSLYHHTELHSDCTFYAIIKKKTKRTFLFHVRGLPCKIVPIIRKRFGNLSGAVAAPLQLRADRATHLIR